MADKKKETVPFHHFTDKKGAEAIAKSKTIAESKPGPVPGLDDAALGQGVYGTKKGPAEYSKPDLLRNNYDDGSSLVKQNEAKAGYVVEMQLPKDKVEAVSGNRDILLHKGPIDLSKTDHKICPAEFGKPDADGGE